MNKIFKGAATALVTPFIQGKIDFDSLGHLIDIQIKNDISALVICGTTGEASTLTTEERLSCIEFAVKRSKGQVPVIAGTGSNCTEKAVYLSREACRLGADALLVVTPYYNKANNDGLVRHFSSVADSSSKPIILYNVPSRTGVNISSETYLKLSEHKNILAVKEAGGNLSELARTMSLCYGKMSFYSGNDDQILPVLSLGGEGVISVVSNVLPKETQNICRSFFSGDINGARKFQLQLLDLICVLFCEVNPIPVKYAMSLMGMCSPEVRLPLAEPSVESKKKICETLKKYGMI